MDKLTYESLVEKLIEREYFSFTRYGDGEWNAMLGCDRPHNCDGHEYFPDLGKRLIKCLQSDPKYYLGIQSLAMRQRGDEITQWVNNYCSQKIDTWSNADILHHASIKGKLPQFFSVINAASDDIILTAPEYLIPIRNKISYGTFITVPEKNCWLHYDRLISDIAYGIKTACKQSKYVVVLLVASMPANVLVHDLYSVFGDRATILDIGSVLDPFVGKNTRTYHSKEEFRKINNL